MQRRRGSCGALALWALCALGAYDKEQHSPVEAVAGNRRGAPSSEEAALTRRLSANAEGAVWKNGLFGYFEREAAASLTPDGKIAIAFQQCLVWGSNVGANDPDEMIKHCGTGQFEWRTARQTIPVSLIDPSTIAIAEGNSKYHEFGWRIVFNCKNRLMGCARVEEGYEGKAPFGLLCKDRSTCTDSADALRRVVTNRRKNSDGR